MSAVAAVVVALFAVLGFRLAQQWRQQASFTENRAVARELYVSALEAITTLGFLSAPRLPGVSWAKLHADWKRAFDRFKDAIEEAAMAWQRTEVHELNTKAGEFRLRSAELYCIDPSLKNGDLEWVGDARAEAGQLFGGLSEIGAAALMMAKTEMRLGRSDG